MADDSVATVGRRAECLGNSGDFDIFEGDNPVEAKDTTRDLPTVAAMAQSLSKLSEFWN